MPLPETAVPVPMLRVAVVAPSSRLREALVGIAQAGCVEPVIGLPPASGPEVDAMRRLERGTSARHGEPVIARHAPDLEQLERSAAWPLLAGEADLARHEASAIAHGPVAAIVGWMPRDEADSLRAVLAGCGAALVELPRPAWTEPPTLLRPVRPARAFQPLVETYGAARYRDLDPTPFTAVTFVVMFGMMFGDVGHGLLLAALSVVLARARSGRLAPWRRLWPLPAAMGLSAAAFGLLYGQAFGPTGLVPTIWLDPSDHPTRLLVVAIGVGVALLALSCLVGAVNRARVEGPGAALLAPGGIAGLALLVAGLLALAGWQRAEPAALVGGLALGLLALILLGTGFSQRSVGGATGAAETAVELFDSVVRTAGNAVSFARLAAFGLVHAAIAAAVLDGARAVHGGALGWAAAIALFVLGNAAAFALEALVASVQALRLEYYELFSRVFSGEGHRFLPWRVHVISEQTGGAS
jgi:V/A-type H+-transporting ATPase subunit I